MKYDPDRSHRRSIRLKGYDYSQAGAYFVTICTQSREPLLEDVGIRSMVQKWWDALPQKFPSVQTDQFVIMPNHIHGIIFILDRPVRHVGADRCVCPNEGQSTTLGEHTGLGEHIGSPLRWYYNDER